MQVISFNALPLPYYIYSGYSLAGPGRKHPERYAVGEFDLLVVKQGCLYIGEEDRRYELSAGHALILRPDLHHYPTEGCRETTASYWLHFQTAGSWSVSGEEAEEQERSDGIAEHPFRKRQFRLDIPQFARIAQPAVMYGLLEQIVSNERHSHLDAVRWKQQLLFQEILQLLGASLEGEAPSPGAEVAVRAASCLRSRYREPITSKELGICLNFHPVYIARCMQKQFGCSPMEYLLRYRLEQARQLLLHTDISIHQIAVSVGFQQAAYFTACFGKREGITPREYRQRYADSGRKPTFPR
ncbi:AraC family transcriptional regulator [Paenibacillus sp. NEAU-GSW1]|uniref:helix-turn-helix transcriptional regulator n=1 Tax=Paenibacillus sp. NEAU-GSW1 TaxID=2682486 RepID=UPI0012E11F08|nr:AraC family transcriptional regulator [Paenibacillus sp. NEAU-GSW1]MUT66568.1 helix-turn-helix domain-containing protein [Paenibacillus sp. NEAU-GSW1]